MGTSFLSLSLLSFPASHHPMWKFTICDFFDFALLSANLKMVYDEEFKRAAENDRERTSFRVEPAQAYIP